MSSADLLTSKQTIKAVCAVNFTECPALIITPQPTRGNAANVSYPFQVIL